MPGCARRRCLRQAEAWSQSQSQSNFNRNGNGNGDGDGDGDGKSWFPGDGGVGPVAGDAASTSM